MVLGFFLIALSLHLEFFGVRITFDASVIRVRSPWRRLRLISWSAVTRVWYSSMMRWYIVETDGFGYLRLHDYLSGTDTLLSELERRNVPVSRRLHPPFRTCTGTPWR